MVEGAPLLRVYGSKAHRGFESLSLRQIPFTLASMSKHRIFTTKFSSVYPHYVRKVESKNRTKQEVDRIICWLTGYTQAGLERELERETDFEAFFTQAPAMQPKLALIKGVVCGVRVEEVKDPLMRKIRCLDKLIDELAKGKPMEKILR